MDPWPVVLERRFFMVLADGSLLQGGRSGAHDHGYLAACLRTGGMPPRRAYPFAKSFVSGPAVPSSGSADVPRDPPKDGHALSSAAESMTAVLIYHGTFAPFHRGHISCIVDAVSLLESNHIAVKETFIACTNEFQASRKLHCQPNDACVSVADRISIIKSLVQQLCNTVVATHAYRTGDAMSFDHHSSPGTLHIHLVGSDVRLKPSPRTVVVMRDVRDHVDSCYLDTFMLFGVCNQTQALGSSSTAIRGSLQRGVVPDYYPIEAQMILRKQVPQHHILIRHLPALRVSQKWRQCYPCAILTALSDAFTVVAAGRCCAVHGLSTCIEFCHLLCILLHCAYH
eukprot:3384783-Amphidinium_carterae.2